MLEPRRERARSLSRRLVGLVLVIVSLSAGWESPASAAVVQRRFVSLEDAVGALVDAMRAGDRKAMLAIFGQEGKGLVWSGDEVSDRRARERFVAAYDDQHRLEAGGGKVVLVVGRDDFPFPIPIVPDGPSWRFDTAAGQGGAPQPAHRAERAQHDPGLPRLRRCAARVLRQRSRRRCAPAVRAEVREQPGKAGRALLRDETGRAVQPARRCSSPERARRAIPRGRALPSPTGATTTGS